MIKINALDLDLLLLFFPNSVIASEPSKFATEEHKPKEIKQLFPNKNMSLFVNKLYKIHAPLILNFFLVLTQSIATDPSKLNATEEHKKKEINNLYF